MTLVEFLTARLDEDKTWALACSRKIGELAPPWRADHRRVFSGHRVADTVSATVAGHIARHDPARVLAEVEAKRQVIELHGEPDENYCCPICQPEPGFYFPCRTLCLLALPYADHPDYDEAWRA
jgi:hypothetical protein